MKIKLGEFILGEINECELYKLDECQRTLPGYQVKITCESSCTFAKDLEKYRFITLGNAIYAVERLLPEDVWEHLVVE